MKRTNESIWGGVMDRSAGRKFRKEDEIPQNLRKALAAYIEMFASIAYTGDYSVGSYSEFKAFVKDFKNKPRMSEIDYDMDYLLEYTKNNWDDVVLPIIEDTIEKIDNDVDFIIDDIADKIKNNNVTESIWGGVMDRSAGRKVRNENELSSEDMDNLEQFLVFYATRIVYDDYEFSLDGLCDYIESNDREGVVSQDANIKGILNYVRNYWADELSDRLSEYVEMKEEERQKNITNECEGVPGGATPASVGGMGAAYFPGPDGTPGSGDLPSPTGIVYHQVAPYTMFLKQIKKKKKKSKKFRKEDEPCVHSPNAKVYDYVDDFREYVDRTYNNMDRR